MPPALRLLLRLRLIALGRSIKKMLSTVRGKIVAVGLFAIVLLLMLPMISDMNAGSSVRSLFDPVTLRKQASLGMFVMLFFVFIKSKKNGVVFSPDEVEHLFSAPFSRRQLLMFKLVTNLSQVVASMFFCIFAYARFTPDFLCASIGGFLSFTFMNYASIFVGLFGQVSAKIAARNYRVAIGVTLVLLLIISPFMFSLLNGQQIEFPATASEFSIQIADSTTGQILLAPLDVFTNIIFADGPGFFLILWVGIAMLQIGCVVAGILWLDVNFLELNAAESKQFQKKIEDAKHMGIVITRKEFRRSIPMLPFWRGIGPIIWRQLLESFRYSAKLLPAVAIIVLITCGFSFFSGGDSFPLDFQDERISTTIGFIAGVSAGMTTLVFVLLAPVGFRSDIERIDVLKALPLPDRMVVIGQLLGASLILTAVQTLVCVVFVCLTQQWIWLLAILGTLPLNYLLFAISGMILLWYPTKPSDESLASLGGNVISMASIYFAMMIVAVVIGLPAGMVYAFSENVAATIIVAILLGVFWCAIVTSLAVSAYKNFDVSSDTPK